MGITAIETLRSMLEQLIETVRAAIRTVMAALEQVRTALETGKATMTEVSTTMHSTMDTVKAQPDALVATVRQTRDDFISAAQPREKVDTVRDRIAAFEPLYLAPVALQVAAHETLVFKAIDDVRAKIDEPVALLSQKAGELRARVLSLRQQAHQPPAQLIILVQDVAAKLNAQVTVVRGAIEAQLVTAGSFIDDLLAKVDAQVQSVGATATTIESTVIQGIGIATAASGITQAQLNSAVDAARSGAAGVQDRVAQWQGAAEDDQAAARDEATASAQEAAALGQEVSAAA
jgi:hypothetical protein